MNSNEQHEAHPGHRHDRGHGKFGHKFGRRHFWKIPIFFVVAVLVKSALVMVLWNFLIPDLFHGPLLDYPHAIGLSILAKLIFGFRGGRGWGRGGWENLTPEQREKLREKLQRRFGRDEISDQQEGNKP